MIYELTTAKSVIAKIIADLQLDETKINISDIYSWVFEALNKIGSVNQLDHRVCVLPIKSYQAKLPCGLVKLDSVAFSFGEHNGWLPMRKTTNSFSVFKHCGETEHVDMLIKDNALYPIVKSQFNLTNDRQAQDILDKDDNIRETLSCLINNYTINTVNGRTKGHPTAFSNALQYDVKPGYIYCNMPEGFLKVSYYGEYLDEEGYPMIPDTTAYAEAIYWYVASKMFFIEWTKGSNAHKELYATAKTSWNYYRKQAYAESLMPNADEIQSIKNTWHTLVPEINEHDTFFSQTGDRHTTYNWD